MAKWEYRDYLEWMVDWLPQKLLKKLFKKQGMHNDDEIDGQHHEHNELDKGTDDKDDINQSKTEIEKKNFE